jgi:hypothetical protein
MAALPRGKSMQNCQIRDFGVAIIHNRGIGVGAAGALNRSKSPAIIAILQYYVATSTSSIRAGEWPQAR